MQVINNLGNQMVAVIAPVGQQLMNQAKELLSDLPHVNDVELLEFKIEGKCCIGICKCWSIKDSYKSSSLPEMKVRDSICDLCASKQSAGCCAFLCKFQLFRLSWLYQTFDSKLRLEMCCFKTCNVLWEGKPIAKLEVQGVTKGCLSMCCPYATDWPDIVIHSYNPAIGSQYSVNSKGECVKGCLETNCLISKCTWMERTIQVKKDLNPYFEFKNTRTCKEALCKLCCPALYADWNKYQIEFPKDCINELRVLIIAATIHLTECVNIRWFFV